MDNPVGRTAGPTNWRRSLMGGLVGAEGRHHLLVRQLPLVVVMAIVTVLMAAFYPAALVDPFYLGGLALLLLSLVLSALVPWRRLPPKAVLLLPIIDILAVGAARAGEAGRVDVFGLLVVFPAIWLATVDKERGAWVATAGMALIIMAPISFTGLTLTPQVWTKLIMLPVTIAAVGLTVSTITQRLEASAQENRQQRELLHSILQAVDVGVVALDTDGRIIVSNDDELAARARAAATALGGSGSSAAAAAAMSQTPIFEPDGKTAIPFDRRPLVRAVRGEYVRNYLFWDRQAGVKVARYATSGPVHDDSGEVVGCVLAFSDVTPLMKAAAAQSAFVAAVSHELRTPLTAILGYTDLLRERLEDDGGPPAPELAVIERGAHRLRVIVEDLLTAASADMSMTPVRLDLAEAIHSAMVSLQPVAQAAKITLEQHTRAAVPALVDPERIGQLLDNLLSNAIKYSPAGTTVVVEAWIDAAAKQLVVEVRDQGRGITAEDAALVFDPFYRSQSVRESAIPGAGLGLSVAKSIAERHGGALRLHSTEGAGTTAEFRLPAPS